MWASSTWGHPPASSFREPAESRQSVTTVFTESEPILPNTDPASQATAPSPVSALADHVENLIATIATSEHVVRRDRLQENIRICSALDRRVLPLGLIFGASTSLERDQGRAFFTRLPKLFTDEILEALDLVSETLLMVSDKDLQASGTIVASVLVQRSLPDGMAGRDTVLQSLLALLDLQYQERAMRHGEIFAPIRKTEKTVTLADLPRLLSDVSEAIEDVACAKDVFLDNPVELVAAMSAPLELSEESFKRARLESGADLPTLSEELKEIAAVEDALGWDRRQALALATDLYASKVMDSRSKIGLSVPAISSVLADLNEIVDTSVKDIEINDDRGEQAPYSYDADRSTLVLNVRHRGALTGRALRAAHPGILEQLKETEADREAARLSKAIEGYHEARAEIRRDLAPLEEETAAIQAFAKDLALSDTEAYNAISKLYRTQGIIFAADSKEGLSVQGLRELVAAVPGSVTAVEVNSEADGLIPFSFDSDSGILKLHPASARLSDFTLRWVLEERSIDPLPLVEPDAAPLSDYEEPEKPGGMASERNMARFIDEFQLAPEFAKDSFDVMLEGCPGLQEGVSIQTLRVLVATLNARLGSGSKIDLVTGWSRDVPGTDRADQSSIAWLTSHTETDEPLTMLTFNFNYGEGTTKLPPFSDDRLLDWCRHHIIKIMTE